VLFNIEVRLTIQGWVFRKIEKKKLNQKFQKENQNGHFSLTSIWA